MATSSARANGAGDVSTVALNVGGEPAGGGADAEAVTAEADREQEARLPAARR